MCALPLQNNQPSVLFSDYILPQGQEVDKCAICQDDLIAQNPSLYHRILIAVRTLMGQNRLKAHNGLHALHSDCYDQLIENIKNNPKCPSCKILIAKPKETYLTKLSKIVKRVAKVATYGIPILAAGNSVIKLFQLNGLNLGAATGLASYLGSNIVKDRTRMEQIKLSLVTLFTGIILKVFMDTVVKATYDTHSIVWFLGGLAGAVGVANSASLIAEECYHGVIWLTQLDLNNNEEINRFVREILSP